MIGDIDRAIHQSRDPPEGRADIIKVVKTGRAGRPRILINRDWLKVALQFRGPKGIAAVLPLKVSPRTVRTNILNLGLADPGNPVFLEETLDDGSTTRMWQPQQQNFSPISDSVLDSLVFDILQNFPNYGRGMITAELQRRGYRVQRRRVREAYVRVHGAPRVWGQRNIERRPYCVAGPNSLWHHDGQHGGLYSL
jgi:hypothetical protein